MLPEHRPSARSGAALIYRESQGRSSLVLYAGYDGMVELDDMWQARDLAPTSPRSRPDLPLISRDHP